MPSSQGADSAGRDVDSVCGATTTNEKPFVVEDSSLPSVGAGLNVNSDGVSEGPTGSLARAGRQGLKLKIDVQDLVPRSDSFHTDTGCVVEERMKEHEQVPSPTTTTKKPVTANMLSLKEMKEASMRSSPPSNSGSALDPPHTLTRHGRSQSSHQLSQMSSSTKQEYAYPPKTPQYIRKKSGELVKPSLKPGRSSMFASSTPHADAIQKKEGGGRAGGRVPIGKLGGLSVNLSPLPPVALGSRSEPTTPTGSNKSVHFDAKLEHVKLFLAEQKPLAVSRDGSPTETSEGATEDSLSANTSFNGSVGHSEEERVQCDAAVRKSLDILALNMPDVPALKYLSEHWKSEHVKLESLGLSEDATCVRGLVLVRNLTFTKWVAARFTLDRWQTTSEVSAKHVTSVPGVVRTPPPSSLSSSLSTLSSLKNGSSGRKGRGDEGDGKVDLHAYDRFEFFIRLTDFMSKIWEKTLHLCVRYSAEGYGDAWDNNGGQNYTVVFKRKMLGQMRQSRASEKAGSTVRWGVGAPDDDDDDNEDENGVGVRMKVAALKKTLEKVMPSNGSSPGTTGMGTPPKAERPASVPAASNQSSPINQSGSMSFVNSRSAQDVLLRVGKQQYSPTQSPVLSPTGPKRTFFMPGGNEPLSPRCTLKEGSLAGRYDLGSSLKNAAAGGDSPDRTSPLTSTASGIPFPIIGSPLRSPVSVSGMPLKAPGSSFMSQNFASTPMAFSTPRSATRGSPRDATMLTQSREVSTGSELAGSRDFSPFRTSSDTDIPASLRRNRSSSPFEFSVRNGQNPRGEGDAAKSRHHQRSYFAPSIVGSDGGTMKTKEVVNELDGKGKNTNTS